MNSISSWIENLDYSTIISEQDVRTKIAVTLLMHLGYDDAVQANEFPIFSFSGRTKNSAKLVDILCFNSKDWTKHKKFESRKWVQENALLSFELKRPSENLDDAVGQAEFYSMNARTPFYMCTNGKDIKIFEMREFSKDTVIFDGKIDNLADEWHLIYNKISFDNLLKLKKVNDEKKEKIYLDYCISLKKQYEDIYSWYWEQTITLSQTEEKISVDDLIKTTSNSALISKAGTGKTAYLHKIFIKACKEYINSSSEIIPVFLSAKLWKRDFSTLIDGIFSELHIFLPHLTIEFVRNEIEKKRIFLFIDGIDECFIDRDILLHEINNFPCKMILSSRENITTGRLRNFQYCELKPLNDSELINISSTILNKNTNVQIYKMNEKLKNLLKTAIYFNMWLTYNINENDKTINKTINISQLYQSFTSYLLKNHIINKGNFDVENIPISSLNDILAKFAYDLYEQNDPDIVKSIKEIYPNSIQAIYKIFLQSGLIFETSDQCEFQQHSLKEYYYANYILTNDEYLDEFLTNKCKSSRYEEIFMILVGLTKDLKKQEIILEYLLENNLSLFIRCLHRRFDFSEQFEASKNKIFYEKFLDTIAQTYDRIIDLYFPTIRKYFLPFCWVTDYSDEMGIVFNCSVDVDNNSIGLNLSINNQEKISTKISYTKNSTKMFFGKNNTDVEIPIGNLKGSMGVFQYNLNTMGRGIDYAREIAVDMIYYNIESILKEKRLLEKEPSLMQFSYVEKWLKKASPIKIAVKDKVKEYNLSLKKQNIDELLSLLKGIHSYKIGYGRNTDKNPTFGILWYLIYTNKDFTTNLDKILFPDTLIEPIGKRGWVLSYYTDEDIIEWVKNYYYFGQITYREFVIKLLPNLITDLRYYQIGPIKYNIDIKLPDRNSYDFPSEGSLSINFHLVNNIKDSEPLITVSDGSENRENFESHYNKLEKEAIFFNRNLTYYGRSSCVLSHVFNRENNIREFVYEKLQKDFKNLFKK